ncbi:helix-turn-helix transcriptional regulator [Leifsonia sp. F6_8S_P_1B]|uniref:Helix-turn-helix transcriptional regulator n=1 Tax=Leifsonia williamsii TaxID=3035919 RepID=A0ABT8KDJ9_9MICO|nr:helix-turn-helix transcriptional regulator [Leifsonia williamsii]MDN4615520.1 helix-turn-helix transcriptional regulator [Leifsonia williamsii]
MTAQPDPLDVSQLDTRRWLRELGALIALPALWLDHEPREVATGLLSVLVGMVQLHGAYASFGDDGAPLEVWRPSSGPVPPEFRAALAAHADDEVATGLTVQSATGAAGERLRVASVPVTLPWERGLVLASAERGDFPTAMETHLLRVAVGQAAIAIHTGRRLAQEHAARAAAEERLRLQRALLSSVLGEVGPPIERAAQRIREAERLLQEPPASDGASGRPGPAPTTDIGNRPSPPQAPLPLTPREVQVLGMLAQGLSNKEIAGILWLSDRTVERHVTSLYRKIGVARRSEATAFALRHGIV